MTTTITLKRKPALNTGRTGPLMSAAQLTLKDMRRTPAVFVQAKTDDTRALRQRIEQLEGELIKAQAAATERAQREDRVRSAPGFREVDRSHEWARKTGAARHQVSVTITGKTVTIADRMK